MGSDLPFFSEPWWRAVIEAWNTSEHTTALAGLGVIRFEADDHPPVHIAWDDKGRASLVSPCGSVPTLSASVDQWRRFIEGEFAAARGVITGRIRYEGRLRAIAPYSIAFNRLAAVSRGLPTDYGGHHG